MLIAYGGKSGGVLIYTLNKTIHPVYFSLGASCAHQK